MKTVLFFLFLLTVVHGHPSNPDPSGPTLRSARALPPTYLEVPEFQLCLDKKTVASASSWCLPEHKPEHCRAEHWTKLWSLGELCPCSQPGLDCSSEKHCCPLKEVFEGNIQVMYNFKEKRSAENPDCMDDCVYTSATDGEDYCFSSSPTYPVKCLKPGEKHCCPLKEVFEGNIQVMYNFKEKRSAENPDCMDDCVYTSATDGEDYCFSSSPTYRVKCLNQVRPFPPIPGH